MNVDECRIMTKDKTILIAGYSNGFGSALKDRFEAEGYTVSGVARSGSATLHADLSAETDVHLLFEKLDQSYPPLAGVIHNAMQFLHAPLLATSGAQMEAVWRSMVMTAFLISQHAVPRLLAQNGGSLIFSGASGSVRAGAGFAAFSSAKFALRGLAQAIAREHGANGIHVAHVVIDGLIDTEKTFQRFPGSDKNHLIKPADLAEQYFHLFHQPPSSWTHELEIRPCHARF